MLLNAIKRIFNSSDYQEYGTNNIEINGDIRINFDFDHEGNITDIYYYHDYS